MNLEQQYRRGRLARLEPVPLWLLARVDDACGVAVDLPAMHAESKRLLGVANAAAAAEEAARELLGLQDKRRVPLVAHTQALADEHPEQQIDYWSAMWAVIDVGLTARAHREHLAVLADAMEVAARYRGEGWPEGWQPELCEVWQDLGGSPATAQGWASRGWSARSALLAEIPQRFRCMTPAERVSCPRPPDRARSAVPYQRHDVRTQPDEITGRIGNGEAR